VTADETTEGLYNAVDGEAQFATTADALKTAASNGGNITLLASDTKAWTGSYNSKGTIVLEKNSTIDLSKNTLTITSESGRNGITVSSGVVATLADGSITMNKVYGSSYPVVYANYGNVTLDNMIITVENAAKNDVCVSAGSNADSSLYIKDSVISVPDGSEADAVLCGSRATLVIENSQIIGNIKVALNGVVTLDGGDYTKATFSGDGKSVVKSGKFSIDPSTGKLKLAEGSTVSKDGDIWIVVSSEN
jgi:hypothetical protein